MNTSLFELFKIGIGPSSSHTVGPMRAALRFVNELDEASFMSTHRVVAELYGSLAHTGIGHGTDRAVLLGLSGETAGYGGPGARSKAPRTIRDSGTLRLRGSGRSLSTRRVTCFSIATRCILRMQRPQPRTLTACALRRSIARERLLCAAGVLLGGRRLHPVGCGACARSAGEAVCRRAVCRFRSRARSELLCRR